MIESMSLADISGAVLATGPTLPPIRAAGYEYVVAANGLFIRAEDSRMEAMVPVAMTAVELRGLETVRPYARIKGERIPEYYLRSIHRSAKIRLPNECMYQIGPYAGDDRDGWRAWMPAQEDAPAWLLYNDDSRALVDLHSHASMPAFFSSTDDADEQGLRFYVVMGNIGQTSIPTALARVGVYGHHMLVTLDTIFDMGKARAVWTMVGPFIDLAVQPAPEYEAEGIHDQAA